MRAAAKLVVIGALLGSARAHADPDFAHAKDLYRAAEAAMLGGRYVEALVDYGSAYDITKDPVLFYKLGSANERAGNCEVAVGFYRRYLAEAHPDANYIALTRDRITACGGDAKVAPTPDVPAPPPPKPPPPAPVAHGHGTAPGWLLVGGTLGLVTIGAVLAYATSSSENDVKDLYAGSAGQPPPFNAATQQRYQQLLDQGHRYETLAWTAFGTAALTATAATIVFLTTYQHERVVPIVTRQAAAISVSGRF